MGDRRRRSLSDFGNTCIFSSFLRILSKSRSVNYSWKWQVLGPGLGPGLGTRAWDPGRPRAGPGQAPGGSRAGPGRDPGLIHLSTDLLNCSFPFIHTYPLTNTTYVRPFHFMYAIAFDYNHAIYLTSDAAGPRTSKYGQI